MQQGIEVQVGEAQARFDVPALPPGADPWVRASLEARDDPRTASTAVLEALAPVPLGAPIHLQAPPPGVTVVVVLLVEDGRHVGARALGSAVSEPFEAGIERIEISLPLTLYPASWPRPRDRRRGTEIPLFTLPDGDSSAASSR